MNKKIEFSYDGVDYTLEYNRDAILYMEAEGLDVKQIETKPLTMISILWRGAFLKNHKREKLEKMQEIYDNIPNKTELAAALSEMYIETYSIFITDSDESDDSKNIQWKMF